MASYTNFIFSENTDFCMQYSVLEKEVLNVCCSLKKSLLSPALF